MGDGAAAADYDVGRREKLLILALTLAVAALRIWSRAASLWDWDEMLFSRALDDFDVPGHSPHPPGFPLFIGLAHLVRPFVAGNFQAIQAVTIASSIALVPAAWWFFLEAGGRRLERILGTLLLVTIPTVAVFGVSGFSDVPATGVTIAACAAFLRARHDGRWIFAGGILAPLACGIRLQSALIILPSAILAAREMIRRREWSKVIAAFILSVGIVVSIYGAAALASGGLAPYARAIRLHGDYISRMDFYGSAGQPAPDERLEAYVVAQGDGTLNDILLWLAFIGMVGGAVRRDRSVAIILLTFLPFFILAFFTLDTHSARRFALAWAPGIAFLAAAGAWTVAKIAFRYRSALTIAIAAGLAAAMQARTIEPLITIRSTLSPPAAAFRLLSEELNREPDTPVYVHPSMMPFAEAMLPADCCQRVESEPEVSRGWYVSEEVLLDSEVRFFYRDEDPLRRIVRERYFHASVLPLESSVGFGPEWYGIERDEDVVWRWMPRTATLTLPTRSGDAVMILELGIPPELLPGEPRIEVRLEDQTLVARNVSEARTRLAFVVPSGPERELTIETSAAFSPARMDGSEDTRELGLMLYAIQWGEP